MDNFIRFVAGYLSVFPRIRLLVSRLSVGCNPQSTNIREAFRKKCIQDGKVASVESAPRKSDLKGATSTELEFDEPNIVETDFAL